ncbi:MAG TPA: PfkB family carbohydrate kinase, partial [Gammaproteobacteria bacterium]
MSRILVSGIATLDIINSVDGFPHEDDEVRASQQQVRYGGNAANTATVLAQLGHDLHFISTLADDMAGHFIADELTSRHITISHPQFIIDAATPTSYITLNSRNGSRTIVHYRDLPELSFAKFDAISLDGFNWCHFEGRNCAETLPMMQK